MESKHFANLEISSNYQQQTLRAALRRKYRLSRPARSCGHYILTANRNSEKGATELKKSN